MKHVVNMSVFCALIVLMAAPLLADDKAEKRKRKNKRSQAGAAILKQLQKAELSDKQEIEVKEIIAKHSEKLAAANKQLAGVRKSMAEARKKAAADGKKGKELREAVEASLSDEQKEVMTQVRELNVAMRQEIAKLLSEEQRKKAGLRVRRTRKEKAANS